MASPKEMLSALIQRGQLKPREKEIFTEMWDAVHRYGSLSPKQRAWIEKEYYGKKLDRSNTSPGESKPIPLRPNQRLVGTKTPERDHRVAYLNYAGASSLMLITNIQTLRTLCPDIRPGTKQYAKIEAFFRNGGEVLKVKPLLDKSA
jgi:hypothetical protein